MRVIIVTVKMSPADIPAIMQFMIIMKNDNGLLSILILSVTVFILDLRIKGQRDIYSAVKKSTFVI